MSSTAISSNNAAVIDFFANKKRKKHVFTLNANFLDPLFGAATTTLSDQIQQQQQPSQPSSIQRQSQQQSALTQQT